MATPAPLKIKSQLLCAGEIAIGPGKADLLEAIVRHGSISGAARAMDMSYRRAWLLVDAMNRCWREPLVQTLPGRAAGGGARLTPAGARVLASYRALQSAILEAASGPALEALTAEIRSEPLQRT